MCPSCSNKCFWGLRFQGLGFWVSVFIESQVLELGFLGHRIFRSWVFSVVSFWAFGYFEFWLNCLSRFLLNVHSKSFGFWVIGFSGFGFFRSWWVFRFLGFWGLRVDGLGLKVSLGHGIFGYWVFWVVGFLGLRFLWVQV